MKFVLLTVLLAIGFSASAQEVGERVAARCGIELQDGKIAEVLNNGYRVEFTNEGWQAACGDKVITEIIPIHVVPSYDHSNLYVFNKTTYTTGERLGHKCGYSQEAATITEISDNGYGYFRYDNSVSDDVCGGWIQF